MLVSERHKFRVTYTEPCHRTQKMYLFMKRWAIPRLFMKYLLRLRCSRTAITALGGKKKRNVISFVFYYSGKQQQQRRGHKMSIYIKTNIIFWCEAVNAWLLQNKVYKHWFHNTGCSSFIRSVWAVEQNPPIPSAQYWNYALEIQWSRKLCLVAFPYLSLVILKAQQMLDVSEKSISSTFFNILILNNTAKW